MFALYDLVERSIGNHNAEHRVLTNIKRNNLVKKKKKSPHIVMFQKFYLLDENAFLKPSCLLHELVLGWVLGLAVKLLFETLISQVGVLCL